MEGSDEYGDEDEMEDDEEDDDCDNIESHEAYNHGNSSIGTN